MPGVRLGVMRLLLALAGLALAAIGCGDDPTFRIQRADCQGRPGSETDLTEEPDYTANYLYRFRNRDGCEVRLDVMMYRKPGSDHHCAPWPPEIVLVNPVDVPFTAEPRIYVRDPDGTWAAPSLPFGFDPNVALPSGARDTGYESDAGRLFVVPDDDRFVYVVQDDRAERWPQEKNIGCS